MAETVTMPKLGFDMREGVLVRWVIAEGDAVKKGAVLAEIETDKATVEVESSHEGFLRRQLVEQGDIVPVGAPIAIVGTKDEAIDSLIPAGTAQAAPKEQTVTTAPAMEASAAPAAAAVSVDGLPGGLRATPLARRIAEDKGIDLRQVNGSGPQGRILRRDVEAFAQRAPVAAAAAIPTAPATSTPAPSTATAGITTPLYIPSDAPVADEFVQLTRLRQAIGRRMVEAKGAVPHFYVTHQFRMEPVMELRKQINAMLPDDQKLSVNDFILKAVALGLRQFPNLNASIIGDQIKRHGAVNVGVAVAVPGGLLTIVSKDADRKPLRLISAEVKAMALRARDGKVRPEDIEGSTFSVSNLGMFDVENFVAIINPPEAAILAVGSAKEVPVVEKGEIKVGVRMNATVSVDHRVSDGAEAARFLQSLALYLEEPLRLLV